MWRRASEVFEGAPLLPPKLGHGMVVQGALNDCYVAAALALVASTGELSSAIDGEALVQPGEMDGQFVVTLLADGGEKRVVEVDDQIPVYTHDEQTPAARRDRAGADGGAGREARPNAPQLGAVRGGRALPAARGARVPRREHADARLRAAATPPRARARRRARRRVRGREPSPRALFPSDARDAFDAPSRAGSRPPRPRAEARPAARPRRARRCTCATATCSRGTGASSGATSRRTRSRRTSTPRSRCSPPAAATRARPPSRTACGSF